MSILSKSNSISEAISELNDDEQQTKQTVIDSNIQNAKFGRFKVTDNLDKYTSDQKIRPMTAKTNFQNKLFTFIESNPSAVGSQKIDILSQKC